MIQLKDYQLRTLDTLHRFFVQCARDGQPGRAFHEAQIGAGRTLMPYLPVNAPGLDASMPYVCLRVPTGGGKTLLACHAAGLAMDDLLHAERAVVLWLVPSNTILDQTAEALRDPRHPYRRALEMACKGSVEVATIEEALRMPAATVKGGTVVIVATIQAFRVEDTTGRKVYAQNGVFSEYLLNVPAGRLADLLPGADGKPKPSLVNALRVNRPIIIVDEAHNARTPLSFNMLGNVQPACIIELTATPDGKNNPSNVLHRVSPAELKAAEMVKLPLRVITRHTGQKDQLLGEAITLRSDLEKLATVEEQETGEYVRPILLIQAESVDECEPLREKLATDFRIPKEHIKISNGKKDDLPRAEEIKSRKCPVRVIITVQKLREGWDCPFAYVLCSLRETRSATAIEQLVGRILRLPNAKTKRHPDLNCAYAFSVSDSLAEVLAELRDALESNGFTKAEAERIILPMQQGALPLGVQPQTIHIAPATELDTAEAEIQMAALDGKVTMDAAKGEITVLVPLDEKETAQLQRCLKTPEAKQKAADAVAQVRATEQAWGGSTAPRTTSPYERGEDFILPLLCVREGAHLFEFEKTVLLEHPWRLGAKDATLSDAYDPTKMPGRREGILDIAGQGEAGRLEARETEGTDFVGKLHQQVLLLGAVGDWTLESLVVWLDQHIAHVDIPAGESAEFIRKAVNGLMARHGISDLGILARDRFRLRDAIEDRINEHRDSERKAAFQHCLNDLSVLVVSPERSLNFKAMAYEPSWLYEGDFRFNKHYFGPKPGELNEQTSRGELTEEFLCARFLDAMPAVRFWMRNLSRKATSFRLQTSTDFFYPDFVCQLVDGRILAVEYKGAHLMADAEEKRLVGAVWAARSGGQCLFVMPTDRNFDPIAAAVGKRAS